MGLFIFFWYRHALALPRESFSLYRMRTNENEIQLVRQCTRWRWFPCEGVSCECEQFGVRPSAAARACACGEPRTFVRRASRCGRIALRACCSSSAPVRALCRPRSRAMHGYQPPLPAGAAARAASAASNWAASDVRSRCP
jgi:hypothetical protein